MGKTVPHYVAQEITYPSRLRRERVRTVFCAGTLSFALFYIHIFLRLLRKYKCEINNNLSCQQQDQETTKSKYSIKGYAGAKRGDGRQEESIEAVPF